MSRLEYFFSVNVVRNYVLPIALLGVGAIGWNSPLATADEIKANNSDPLNTGTSWVSGLVPDSSDVIVFDNTLTLSTAASLSFPAPLGGDLSVAGVLVAGPVLGQTQPTNGIYIPNPLSANMLTIGASGIDMSAASAVPIQFQSKIMVAADQTWNVNDASANITNPAPVTPPASQTNGNRYSPFGESQDVDLYFFSQAAGTPVNLNGKTVTKLGLGTAMFTGGYAIAGGTIDVNEGVLVAQGGGSRATTIGSDVVINVSNGATLRLQNGSNASITSDATINLNGNNSVLQAVANASNSTNTINNAIHVAGDNIISLSNNPISGGGGGDAAIAANLTGSGNLSIRNTRSGSTLFRFSGDNSGFSGTVQLDATSGSRIVRLSTTTAGSASATWTVNSGNTLQINGLTSPTLGSLNGAGTVINSSTTASATVNIGAGNFSGVLANGTAAASTLVLTKVSSGTLTLSGINTYTGTTTINQGTFALGADSVIADASDFVLAGGTFATGGFDDTVGTLSVTANSVLDIGSDSSILHFGASNSASWTGNLTIDNWSGSTSGGGTDQIYIGSDSNGLTPAQLGAISFTGFGSGASILSTGEIVPLSTILAGDFDGDGDVDGADFVIWQTNFPTPSGATLATGDADDDDDVDGADFAAWQTSFPTAPAPGATPIPESSSVVLTVIGSISMSCFYFFRRSKSLNCRDAIIRRPISQVRRRSQPCI